MVNRFTFPRADINVKDIPVKQPADPTVLPLHLPLFMSFAETGPVGVPVLGGTISLTSMFGNGFLDERSAFFQHPNVFIKNALPFQQIYFVRLADPTATEASFVLECTVTPGDIPQYQRTAGGALILDLNGDPKPLLGGGGLPVTEPGVTLSFSTRPLTTGETLTNLTVTTTSGAGGATIHTYPLMAFKTHVGSAGNRLGFRLFYDAALNHSLVDNIDALTYAFQPVRLLPDRNIETPIFDIYGELAQTFAFKPAAFDPSTSSYYELRDVVTANFRGTSGLPYEFHVYSANAGAIGEAILSVSPELGAISPYMVNILDVRDLAGNTYHHAVLAAGTSAILNPAVVNYLEGGTDGALTKAKLEELTVDFVAGLINPEISNSFRYPFTHIYDSGFTMVNKQALMAAYAVRDDVKIDFSTQDAANPPNTAAQDQSAGAALRAAALLFPESTDFGTQACRAAIFQQCGKLADGLVWPHPVPATLDRMIKRCRFNGQDFVSGEPKGRPNSEVTVFDRQSLNWTPATAAQMQLNWSAGLNYIQYCDVQTLFYPDLISVYPIDTSLLSGDVFVDYLIYLKKIIRRQWTIFVGRDDPPKSLFQDIEKAIDAAATYAFNNTITTETVVSQTAADTALGYQLTVTTTVKGNMPGRVWKVIVPIVRA